MRTVRIPMLRYRSLSPEFTVGSVVTEAKLRCATLDLGLSRVF